MKHEILIVCNCSSAEHQMLIRKFSDEDEAYIHIHLKRKSFFKRLISGIKYIFGYKCKYGDFEEIIVDKDNTEQLYEMLKEWHGGE